MKQPTFDNYFYEMSLDTETKKMKFSTYLYSVPLISVTSQL